MRKPGYRPRRLGARAPFRQSGRGARKGAKERKKTLAKHPGTGMAGRDRFIEVTHRCRITVQLRSRRNRVLPFNDDVSMLIVLALM